MSVLNGGRVWISKRLGISLTEAKDAIERMKRVGLIEQTDEGLRAVDDFVLSPDGIFSSSQVLPSFYFTKVNK